MKRLAFVALLVACSHAAKTQKPPEQQDAFAAAPIKVQDAMHGVTYELLQGDEPWQVTHDGNARTASGVQVDVAQTPLAKQASPAACRDYVRGRFSGHDQRTPSDPPRDPTIGDSPTATWSFTTGPASAVVRNRWAFFARGADCVILQVSSSPDDKFADRAFDSAARSMKVLDLPPERQRDLDLMAGMTFLEHRDPQSALDRFEALTKREPDMAKAHFGALMAGFEIGQQAYARALPHGKAALKAEHDLTPDQRELALRAVGVMQLEENQVKEAAATLAELIVRAPRLAEGQYNYACALARLGETQEALHHLKDAIELNADLATHAKDDEDLKSLRALPDFQKLTEVPQAKQ